MKWLSQNYDSVIDLSIAHLLLTIPAVILSLVIAVPIGRLATRRRWLRGPTLGAVGVLYAIPSLPLFIVIPSLFGTGLRSSLTMIIVLTIYGTAVLVRSTADAFGSVSSEALSTATALGYSGWGRFWGVELPLALPVLLAGLRVVLVSTISLVTVGSLIGVRTLGTLFTDGFQRGIVAEVLTGLIVVVALAVVLDLGIVGLGRLLLPWTRPARRLPAAN